MIKFKNSKIYFNKCGFVIRLKGRVEIGPTPSKWMENLMGVGPGTSLVFEC